MPPLPLSLPSAPAHRSLRGLALVPVLLVPWLLGGCRSAYYSTLESFGVHKRDILVERIEEGRTEQTEAKEQFQATWEAFRELSGFEGGELEEVYERLRRELEDSEGEAADVRARIDDIEKVSADLFTEWEQEITEMESRDLRARSEEQLRETRARYGDLIGAMQRAEERMEPVLAAFRDHVTYLKHNLNARAIASLQDSVLEIEEDVASLVADMTASIEEADAFLETLEP